MPILLPELPTLRDLLPLPATMPLLLHLLREFAAPNHALQRTAPAVTLAASAATLPPTVQPARQPPPSLSLGFGDFAHPALNNPSVTNPIAQPRSYQNKMKAIIATVTVVVSLLGARLNAADATPTAIPVEQLFQQADVELAIEQYKKLRMAAFDLTLKLETEATLSEEQQKQLRYTLGQLQERAHLIRDESIRRAAVAATNSR